MKLLRRILDRLADGRPLSFEENDWLTQLQLANRRRRQREK